MVEKLHYKTVEIPKLARRIARGSSELVGNASLVRLNRITKGAKAEVVAKLESFNSFLFNAPSTNAAPFGCWLVLRGIEGSKVGCLIR